MYTFCTDCWLIAVLYFTWLAFDWDTPKKGEQPGGVSLLVSCCMVIRNHLMGSAKEGAVGRDRDTEWAEGYRPQDCRLALSGWICPNVPQPTFSQHCILFPERWQEITMGTKLGCVALLSRLLSHPGKDLYCYFGRIEMGGILLIHREAMCERP